MNFYESHSNVLFLCRFFSLHFFSHHKDELKLTRKSFFISSVHAIIYLTSLVLGYMFTKIDNSDLDIYGDRSSILFIISMLGIVAQQLNSFVIIISSVNQRKEVLVLYEKLYELDNNLKNKLNIEFDYKMLKQNTLKTLGLLGIPYFILSAFINYIYINHLSYIPLSIIFNFINGAEIVSSLEYFYLTKIIKYRFNAVNKLLKESIKTSKIYPSQIDAMIKSHISTNCLITDLNNIHGVKKLSSLTNDFFLFLSQFYAFFISLDNGKSILSFSNSKYLIGLMSMPFTIGKIVTTAIGCKKAIKAQHNFGKLLKAIGNNADGSELVYNCEFLFSI